jgi:squalene-hopene/tetraprenyl-beta-curcumene cyclase
LIAARLQHAWTIARDALLAERTAEGVWVGELSTSALSTATAVAALSLVQRHAPDSGSYDALIQGGITWLATNQNADGGWGDTIRSFSNISTTMLCRAAFHISGTAAAHVETLARADGWLARSGTTQEQLAEAIRARYGKDRTFSVPILMMSALAGLVPWGEVPSLPFELACLPQSWFAALSLPVVSYALPALIAIGQAVYHHRRPNWLIRPVRWLARGRSLRVLESIQPENGGFLEAAPLTSFVTMALASIGQGHHPVARRGVAFLVASVRPDGSWPIDTNLSTWVTTLSVNALAGARQLEALDHRDAIAQWLCKQQFHKRHPYTGAAPGGWGWTPLPGSVPDADDTPGALLALHHLTAAMPAGDLVTQATEAASVGVGWLLDLQNRDRGWPTFCRGWTNLPFDRSGSDLTAHALRAIAAWMPLFTGLQTRMRQATAAGLRYLERHQRPEGSWLPLWFGNQHAHDDENPTYGTAKVLAAFRDLAMMSSEPARRGIEWLCRNQNQDGGWGAGSQTPSSVEETALALDVLLDAGPAADAAVNKGLDWLVQQVETGSLNRATPIGFYFAKLWYFEKLYPIIFSVTALGRALHMAQTKP